MLDISPAVTRPLRCAVKQSPENISSTHLRCNYTNAVRRAAHLRTVTSFEYTIVLMTISMQVNGKTFFLPDSFQNIG
jgi:hypothetical protein